MFIRDCNGLDMHVHLTFYDKLLLMFSLAFLESSDAFLKISAGRLKIEERISSFEFGM